MNISIESNLAQVNKAIQDYALLSGKTVEEALKKQAVKLGFLLKQELRAIAPAKGSIRAQLLERLASGLGVKVSPQVLKKVYQSNRAKSSLSTRQTVFGKGKKSKASVVRGGSRLNLWSMAVKAEIARRESARGFLSVSARYQGLTATLEGQATAESRYGPVLSTAGFQVSPGGGSFEFQWGQSSDLSESASEGLSKAKGDAAINRALVNTAEDIEVYIERKLEEGWSR
jgi:hypothetical protein